MFEDSSATDSEEMEVKGVDLLSHKDMFHTVYEKVIVTMYRVMYTCAQVYVNIHVHV